MLQAMVDDSGTRDSNGGVYLLGALVASVSDWINLTEEWVAELDQPPRAAYFRLQDAIQASGEYYGAGSKPEMLAVKVRKFTGIVQRHVRSAYVVDMSVQKFNELFKPTLTRMLDENHNVGNHDLDGIASPYYWLALTLLRGIDYQGFAEETNVVFDDQGGEGMCVQEWWPRLVIEHNAKSRRIPLVQRKPDYRADQDFAPLQAANSFAWLAYRAYQTEPLASVVAAPPTLEEFLGSISMTQPKHINAGLLKRSNRELIADAKRAKKARGR
jgi:hypothetical protein